MRATVMDDAVIESGAMVAAGALVGPGKRIPRGELWAGTPARFMRKLTDADVAGIVADAAKYVEHAASYRKILGL
jgi:carbonic anhydrase/acetyltransferase-like protein (isoleucine patch superfamily)